MKTIDVLVHFRGNRSAVARELGITPQAVRQWPDRVPFRSALLLSERTKGALKFNPKDYV